MNRRLFTRSATALMLLLGAHLGAHAEAWVDAEVKKIDKPAARVTLKHGEIRALDVPAMTMTWRVKDAAMLDNLQVGDHIQFSAERSANQYVITQIKR